MSTMRSYAASIPAETCSLKALRAFFASVLEEIGCSDPEPVILALDEACSNVIRYRCQTIDDGVIQVTAELDPGLLRFGVLHARHRQREYDGVRVLPGLRDAPLPPAEAHARQRQREARHARRSQWDRAEARGLDSP